MKIAIVAGGTGGHIYPALTLAEALQKRGHEICFIGSNDRMEKDVIPQNGFDYIGLDVVTTRLMDLFSTSSCMDHHLLSAGRFYSSSSKASVNV